MNEKTSISEHMKYFTEDNGADYAVLVLQVMIEFSMSFAFQGQ